MAKAAPIGKKMLDAGLDLLSPKHSFLSTFLLQEKKKADSFWRPYIDLLPSDYNSFPVFFDDADLKMLEGSPFLEQVKEKKSDLKKDYDAILNVKYQQARSSNKVAPEFGQYSFHEFCWARMTASSRIFGIVIGEDKTDAFVPLAGILNGVWFKIVRYVESQET
jgi:histone-lysine N-methyltransferase SETD3